MRAVIGLIAITVIGAAIWHRRPRYTSTPRSAHLVANILIREVPVLSKALRSVALTLSAALPVYPTASAHPSMFDTLSCTCCATNDTRPDAETIRNQINLGLHDALRYRREGMSHQ